MLGWRGVALGLARAVAGIVSGIAKPAGADVDPILYILNMFEWDARKAVANRTKHGVSFEEAATVFGDPDALDGPDLHHSEEESRSSDLAERRPAVCSSWRIP